MASRRPFLLLLLVLVACRTSTTTSTIPSPAVIVPVARPTHAWEAVVRGAVVGVLVEFELPDDPRGHFFSVRNESQQDLGMVDALGRAWRFQPHSEDAELLGSGTVARGVALILELDEGADLYEVPLDTLAAEVDSRAAAPSGARANDRSQN